MKPQSGKFRRSGRGRRNSDDISYTPGRRGQDSSSSSSTSTNKTAAPRGFFAKVMAFLGLGGSPAKPSGRSTSPSHRPSGPTSHRDEESDSPRRERGERSDRGERTDRGERSERPPKTSRKPEHVDVTTPRLYVGNLSFDATEEHLSELFNGVGQVQSAEVVTNKHTHRSKGFAFVQMLTVDEAKRAVIELHDKEYMGRRLVVSGAKNATTQDGADSDEPSASYSDQEPA